MGIVERRERQKSELKQAILAAAEELFIQDGYGNVSMRKIAEKVEYSATTLYRLFENKADIMEHLINEGYRGVYERYEEILARRPDSPLETLNLIVAEYVDFALQHPKHYELWFSTSQIEEVDGELRMTHGRTTYRVYSVWIECIEECRGAGLFAARDSLAIFQLIWGAVHGLISLRIHHPHFPWMPLREHVAELLALLNSGLREGRAPRRRKGRKGR